MVNRLFVQEAISIVPVSSASIAFIYDFHDVSFTQSILDSKENLIHFLSPLVWWQLAAM